MSKSIEQLFSDSSVAVTNASVSAPIAEAMGLFGYTPVKLGEGKSLIERARGYYHAQLKEEGEKSEASALLQAQRDVLNKSYKTHIKIGRIALKSNVSAFHTLAFGGARKRTNAGWITQVRAFYFNLLENTTYLEAMAKFGIDQAKLEAVMLKVEEVEKTFARYQKEMGETQEATLVRDETVDALQEWYGDFRAVAKIALEEKPQMLEALGVVVKR